MPSSCAGGSFTYNVKNDPILFKGTPSGIDHKKLNEEITPGRQVQSGTVAFADLSKWAIDVGYNVSNVDTFEVTLSATCDISVDITPEWYVLDSTTAASTEITVNAQTMAIDIHLGVQAGKYVFVQSVWWTTESDKAGCLVQRPSFHVLYTQPDIAPIIFHDICVGCAALSKTFYPMTGMQGDSIVAHVSTMDLAGCLNAPVLKTGATVMTIDEAKGVVSPPPVTSVPSTDSPLSGGVCAPIVTLLVAAIALVLA